MKDYKRIQQSVPKDMARSLGPNVGSEQWEKAQEKKEKAKEFAEKLRNQNKMFGIANADKNYGQSMELSKKVLREKPKRAEAP